MYDPDNIWRKKQFIRFWQTYNIFITNSGLEASIQGLYVMIRVARLGYWFIFFRVIYLA